MLGMGLVLAREYFNTDIPGVYHDYLKERCQSYSFTWYDIVIIELLVRRILHSVPG